MHEAIRVVVVDDSPFVCQLLTSYLEDTPDVRVVGTALNGQQAVKKIKQLRPHVVTLDVQMPGMGGLEALDSIMHECPTPVVLVSGVSRQAAQMTLEAVQMGAVDFIFKYTPGAATEPEALRRGIIAKVRAAAQVRVIRSLRRRDGQPTIAPLHAFSQSPSSLATGPLQDKTLLPAVIVIGASTGGPTALRQMLAAFPADFPGAVLIVQHIPEAFTAALAAQLDRHSALAVREAVQDARLEPGVALIAPGGVHVCVRSDARIQLSSGPAIGGHRPSIDVTMQSVAQVYGARTHAVVLTGMGSDGALGVVAVHAKGGMTYAQDSASCVIDSMPKHACATGIIDVVAPPAQLAHILLEAMTRHRRNLQ